MSLEQSRLLAVALRKIIIESGHGEVTIIIERGKVVKLRTATSWILPPPI
jgi:hypothetical protein